MTGERFVPVRDRAAQATHLHRYLAASGLVAGKTVLDIASGEGFGAWFLAQKAARVVGVDISDARISHASARYQRANLEYMVGDCRSIPLPHASVDVVVSLGTLEHIAEHPAFLAEIRRVLKPGGRVVVSTPETASPDAAPENPGLCPAPKLSRGEFAALLQANFSHSTIYEQAMTLASVIWPGESGGECGLGCSRLQSEPWWRDGQDGFVQEKTHHGTVILIGIASDRPIDDAPMGSIFQVVPFQTVHPAPSGEVSDLLQEALERESTLLRELRRSRAGEISARVPVLPVASDRGPLQGTPASRLGDAQRARFQKKAQWYSRLEGLFVLAPGIQEKMGSKRRKYERRLRTHALSLPPPPTPDVMPDRPAPSALDDVDRLLLARGQDLILQPGSARIPTVSVVIPVFNQLSYTLACLRSLAIHETRHAFEVIVVDDGSTDGTAEELGRIDWVRYMPQARNGGFIASCNAGLAAARGAYVVFLNNDTEVLPGWLDELVETFSNFPEAGLAGSKLLYPDGRLQESGGILWKDGSAWNFGRGRDPRQPEFSYARQVDYVSGASIMLPRQLLQDLGGFDTHFAPAYCEDSDLALRVRAAGRSVIVQPLSQVIHYEGVSSGTDTSVGVKAYQVTNTKKLRARWKHVLAERPQSGETPSDAKDFGLRRRLLIIDEITPEPERDAGSVTCFEMMRAAQALGFQITFIPSRNFADIPDYTARLQRIGIEALYGPYCTSVEQHLRDCGSRYDVILAFRVGLLYPIIDAIRKHAPKARLVYQTSDLHHLREERRAEVEDNPDMAERAALTRERELMLVRAADATIIHSTFEQDYLARLAPGAQLEVFNWVLDRHGTEVPFEARNGLMFLGSYRHTPNLDAVHWFLDDIWPLVSRQLPGAVFHVVGSNLPDHLRARADERINMVGFAEDLRPIMDACRMSVAPLRFGAGTKGKLAMSLSYGLPAVTTSIGAEGMGLAQGEALYIADDPEDFARRIVQLHCDAEAWARMSKAGLDYVERNLSRQAGIEIMRRALLGRDAGPHET